LYKDRNGTIDTILRLARLTWDSVDKLEAQFNSKMFFVARPEKIPERENQLTRNIFKLYLEVGIIIDDETESFQNEIRMILLTAREMVWSLSQNLKFLSGSEEEKYKVAKMLKAFKVFRVSILDVAYTVLIQNTQAYATPNVTNFAAEFIEVIRAIADGFAVRIELRDEPSEERMKNLLKALRCDIDHK
jgi:hypothetical protein